MIINDVYSDAKVGLDLGILDTHGFVDSSWGNDEMASFNSERLHTQIWVDYPEGHESRYNDAGVGQFYVVKYFGDDEEEWIDKQCDTLEQAIAFALTAEKTA